MPLRHPVRWVTAAVALVVALFVIRLFATSDNIDWAVVGNNLFGATILSGVVQTIILTLVAMTIATVLGALLAILRLSSNPVLSWLSWAFVWFFAGTPVLVQLIFWFNLGLLVPTLSLAIPFGPTLGSTQTNAVISGFTAAILGLSLHYGAYMAEIVRAGLLSVDSGQREAAQALGMSSRLTMGRVTLPQAMRFIIPPTSTQFLSLLKTTSLVSVIGGGDLLTRAQEIYSRNFRVIELLIVASIWYLVLTSVAAIGQHYIEGHYARGVVSASSTRRSRRMRLKLIAARTQGEAA